MDDALGFFAVAAIGIWFVPTPADIYWMHWVIGVPMALGLASCVYAEMR